MPAVYEKLGVRFMYPENWVIDEGEPQTERNAVSVYSPGGAFWSLAIYPPDSDPAALADEVRKALREEYEHLDTEPVEETIGQHLLVGYNLDFFYIDLISTAVVRAVSTPTGTYLIHCQAEDREFAKLEPVFQAITTSLLRGPHTAS